MSYYYIQSRKKDKDCRDTLNIKRVESAGAQP